MKRLAQTVLLPIVFLCFAPIAAAATFNVSTYVDLSDPTPDGTCDLCSLREAIQEANALPGPDVINLPPGRYNLDIAGSNEDQGLTGDLDITDDVTIIGIGTTMIESHVGRILHIHAGNVSITGLTLTQGDGAGDTSSNRAGGAIHNAAGSTLTLSQCTMSTNQAQGGGGAIFNAGTLSLNGSTLRNNSAVGTSRGGAVHNLGTMTVTNTTLDGNSSTDGGGAIYSAPGSLLVLKNVTITGNASTGGVGGGGLKSAAGASISVSNTIIANNSASGPDDDCEGEVTSLGSNLVEDADGCVGLGAGDTISIDPALGPLQNNGGRTLTRAPQVGSPVLETGGTAGACEARDQRGLLRPQGPGCEEGSYEQFLACPTIDPSPIVLPDGQDGVFYTQTIVPTGGVPPYTFAVTGGSLPDGLALDPVSGVVSGVPTGSGSDFVVTAFDANLCAGSLEYALGMTSGPSCSPTEIHLSPTQLPEATPGMAYTQTLLAEGGAAPHLFSVTDGSLPPSLALDPATGAISGTPTTSGTFVFVATATDASTCTGDQGYTLQVACFFTYAPASLPAATVGTAYSQNLTVASGGTAPYAFAVVSGALPDGMSLTGTGLLSGTPTTPGTYTFLVEATDANFCTGKIGFILVVDPCLQISPTVLSGATVGSAYSATLTATGGSAPVTFSVTTGGLPPDLALDPSGALAGTPTTPGTYFFTVTATDGTCSLPQEYFLIVNPAGCAAVTITPATLPGDTEGNSYNQNLSGNGGNPPYVFQQVAGTLPPDVDLGADGHLTGTLLAPGLYAFTVAATDSAGCAGTQSYSLLVVPLVCPSMDLFPPVLPDAARGVPYAQTLLASGGIAPYAYAVSAGALPPGLALDGATGAISGTPTDMGDFSFTVTVTDLAACTGTFDFTVHVSPDLRGANCTLFGDTFEDDLLAPAWSYLKPTWNESEGSLTGSSSKKALAVASPGFLGCRTCSIETALQTTREGDGKISLIGWFVDKRNFMELVAFPRKDLWLLKEHVNGTVVAQAKVSRPIAPNVTYTVRVAFDGTQFTVFVDDLETPLMTFTPRKAVPSGTAGFQVKASTASFAYVCVN